LENHREDDVAGDLLHLDDAGSFVSDVAAKDQADQFNTVRDVLGQRAARIAQIAKPLD
jgi:hypothetical protein